MPLPTQASRASAYVTRRACALVLLALSLGATPALASRYVVDINGGGDFATVQAAIDQQAILFRDTILVMPGEYEESPWFPLSTATPPTFVIGASGAAATSVQSIGVDSLEYWGRWTAFEGLTFEASVAVHSRSLRNLAFTSCVFRGPVHFSDPGNDDAPRLSDCDFYGRTRLESLLGYVRNLRFHGAPLYATPSFSGSFYMIDCTFEGPADTLVYIPWSRVSDVGDFTNCTFARARNGIVYGTEVGDTWLGHSNCRFLDLTGAAIFHEDSLLRDGRDVTASLAVEGCRFERCGTAVHWMPRPSSNFGRYHCARDTVLDCAGDGMLLGPGSFARIEDCVVDGNGGTGIVVQQTQLPPNPRDGAIILSAVTVSRSRFTRNRGDGLAITDQDSIPFDPSDEDSWWIWPDYAANWIPQRVDSCTFADNGGVGLKILAPKWRVMGNVAFGNGGDGFTLGCPDEGLANSAISNTSVLNGGAGIVVSGSGDQGDSIMSVQHNLAAMNAGAGFRVPHQPFGSFAFNDSWSNYLGQYVGAWGSADSNLTLDPRFCNLASGIAGLGLQQGSSCGPGGVHGLIGARTEECPNVTSAPPAPPGDVAFVVRPTVARGSVEFVPPASGPEGRVGVFDLSGRRVWEAAFGPTTGTLRWRGESATGHARAALYWVRFTRAGQSSTQRLVWLK